MARHFMKGAGSNALEFPLSAKALQSLQNCDLASPKIGKNHGITMPAALCNEAARREALAEVLAVREQVKDGVFPRQFMEKYYPEQWGTFPAEIPALLAAEGLTFDNPVGLADVVHMDNPLDLGAAMLNWLRKEGVVKKSANAKVKDFLDVVPATMRELGQAVDRALNTAFEIKYFYGVERPEELAGENMTHYPEGCPTHPSFPAGHGAAAFASFSVFEERWGINEDQRKALFDAAYIWSMARTFAGVHYAVDNLTFAPAFR